MKEELMSAIPEFSLVEDDKLQAKCVETFLDAMRIANWSVSELDEMPFTLLIRPCPASFLEHTRRVTQTALAIARALAENWEQTEAMQCKQDILLATALLHDVGKLLEYERAAQGSWRKSKSGKLLRHPASGAGLCTRNGLPDEVVHGVMYHSHEGDGIRATLEAIIVHHADFLNFEPLVLKHG
ncbi:MAG: hypothetical protein A2Y63_00410 [Candidatus Riflebacteria bacterium RBG_13_59_9]|nr:MAG: hypothetical protein A2Y63_00410 [Candidatus Riflebacteria bacterium RBG_13_59_9]